MWISAALAGAWPIPAQSSRLALISPFARVLAHLTSCAYHSSDRCLWAGSPTPVSNISVIREIIPPNYHRWKKIVLIYAKVAVGANSDAQTQPTHSRGIYELRTHRRRSDWHAYSATAQSAQA